MAAKKFNPPTGPGPADEPDDDPEGDLVRRLTSEETDEEIARVRRPSGRPTIAKGTHPNDPPSAEADSETSDLTAGDAADAEERQVPMLRLYEEQSE